MLIRRCITTEIPKLLQIWLQATLHAYDYLPAAIWWPRQEAMNQKLQACRDVWVVMAGAEGPADRDEVVGFMAIADQELLALYILPEYQGQHMGSALMELAQHQHPYLYLQLCLPNGEALQFYRKRGFRVVKELHDRVARCEQCLMEYGKP